MFEIICKQCGNKVEYRQGNKDEYNNLQIVKLDNTIEIWRYNGDEGWGIRCSMCSNKIEEEH